MFNVESMNRITTKVREGRMSSWNRLKQDIRERAYRGYDYMYLYNTKYLLLVQALRNFGFEVEYDQDEGLWVVKWDDAE